MAKEKQQNGTPAMAPAKRKKKFKIPGGVIGLGGLLVVWYLATTLFNVPVYMVPSPVVVVENMIKNAALLWANTKPTVYETMMGFLIGNLTAILLAVLFVHVKFAQRALFPIAVFIRTIPTVAIAPIFVIIFGTGFLPKIIIAALSSFFPTLVNMVRGFESVEPAAIELMRVLSATKTEIFFKVRVYASLPYLFSALKIAATGSVIGALVAEWVGSEKGLGYLIIQATYNFQTPLLYSAMVCISLFATLLFALIGLTERLVVTWQVPDQP